MMQTSNSRNSCSYKFQRLREEIRDSIKSGEFPGKLPGERALANRFGANPKTVGKALNDLTAEGMLDRKIGHGTFIKGRAPRIRIDKRWLVMCDQDQVAGDTVWALQNICKNIEITTDLSSSRPSFLNRFSAVIDLSSRNNDAVLRELIVRHIRVVVVGSKAQTYSTRTVQYDYAQAVSMAGRDLMLGGHLRFAAVESKSCAAVVSQLRATAARYAPDAAVEPCILTDIRSKIEQGVTAFVCGSPDDAEEVKEQFDRFGISIPKQVSLMAVGAARALPACSGYFIDQGVYLAAIVQLIHDDSERSPTKLWLAGRFVDRHTAAAVSTEIRIPEKAN
jgi:DNA-binding transcriptional regulator YhcF (GntR family)